MGDLESMAIFLLRSLLFSFVTSSKLNIFVICNNDSSRKKSHPDVADYFKELQLYNRYIGKPKIKRLKTLIYSLNFLFMKN